MRDGRSARTQQLPMSRVLSSRSRPGSSYLRVSTVVWALVLLSVARITLFSYQRPVEEFANVNISALLAIVLTVAGLVTVGLAPPSARVWSAVRATSLSSLYLYYGFCVVTALWSISPGFSAFRAAEALSQLALVTLGVYYTRGLIDAERLLCRGTLVVVLLSVLGKIKFYSFEVSMESLHSNQYPVMVAAAALYCLAEYLECDRDDTARRRRLRNWGLAFALMVPMGSSAGTMVAVVAGVLVLGMIQRFDRRVLVVGLLALLAVFYAYGISRGFWWNVVFQGKEYEDVVRLSGRRSLFEAYLDAASERPVLGYGFAVAARIGDRFGTVSASHAHNGFLEMLLGGGAIGLMLGLRWLYRLLREVRRSLRRREVGAAGFAAAFTVMTVNNLSITIYGGAWTLALSQLGFLLALFCLFVRGRSSVAAGSAAGSSSDRRVVTTRA